MSARRVVRVCHLSSGHRPDDVRIMRKECATLAAAGYDVRLVVPAPGPVDLGNGVKVVPVPVQPTRGRRLLHTGRQVLRAALGQDAAVYHFHDVDLLPVGLALKLLGKRVVYDAHEDFPAQLRRMASLSAPARRVASAGVGLLEPLAVKAFDAVVAATPAVGRRFPNGKTWVIQNFPIASELAFAGAGRPHGERPRRAIYAGGLSPTRGALEMVRAMARFPPGDDAELVLCATIKPPSLRAALVREPAWARVREAGWLGREDLAHELGQARVGLVVLHPSPQYVESQPVKLFEYMAAGLPVVASDFPLWRSIVEEAGCGLLVDPLDPGAIGTAVQRLLDDPREGEAMGRRGQEAVRRRFDWSSEAAVLLRLYETLLGPSPRPAGARPG